jgi:hypothetical protein
MLKTGRGVRSPTLFFSFSCSSSSSIWARAFDDWLSPSAGGARLRNSRKGFAASNVISSVYRLRRLTAAEPRVPRPTARQRSGIARPITTKHRFALRQRWALPEPRPTSAGRMRIVERACPYRGQPVRRSPRSMLPTARSRPRKRGTLHNQRVGEVGRTTTRTRTIDTWHTVGDGSACL